VDRGVAITTARVAVAAAAVVEVARTAKLARALLGLPDKVTMVVVIRMAARPAAAVVVSAESAVTHLLVETASRVTVVLVD
jgi:hypothetical protein